MYVSSVVSGPLPWTLQLVGVPRLIGPAGPVRVERRTALLLAYLALEGARPRARMAALLWPDAPDKTARANLRQLVHRLRETTGDDLVSTAEPLAIAPGVIVDVDSPGRLLEGIDLDEPGELADWLARVRADVDQRRVASCHAAIGRLEETGDLSSAIAQAHRALAIDPLSETSYRHLMRLHYLAGDRAAAQAAYTRCRVALREALGVEPSTETVGLADEIARARRPSPRSAPAIPLAVQRPPVLAGREREWALMEEAWAAHKGIMIGGTPGIGKTRLMQEFLRAHARPLFLSGRPGDRAVPYGTHARTFRETVEAAGGADVLPPWVRRELARIIPQLGEAPGPLANEDEKLRFWNAKVEALRLAHAAGYDALGFDDLQYVDPASATAGEYVLSQLRNDPRTPVRTVHCYRAGELPDEVVAIVRELAHAGAILHLELAPLDDTAVRSLVQSLGLPDADAIAPELARYAGGVPLFVLETIKHLLETGGLDRAFPARLPPPGRAGEVLQARLARLSPAALELARTVAICGQRFDLDLGAAILGRGAAALVEPWSELEAAQIVRGSAFTHDLLAEAVLAGMPAAVRAHLHRAAAEAMAAAGVAPGAVAAQWLEAGDLPRAARSRTDQHAAARAAMLEHEIDRYIGTAVGS